MTAFSNAIALGMATLASIAGEAVIYVRGANQVAITGAVPGDEFRGSLIEAGVAVESITRDWIIEVSQLDIPTVGPTTPLHGDLIEHVVGGKTYSYEVGPLFSGDVAWRWSDRGQSRIRVHSRLKGVA